ncbi:reverse transcriptase domain-containing protein [Tanacetum coccineum]
MSATRQGMGSEKIKQLIAQCVADAMTAYEANRKSGNGFYNETSASARGVKYASCTLLDGALTWWNSYMQTIGIGAAYETSWKELMKMMTEDYCPRNELQKMGNELWNLNVKGTDVIGYTKRF